jgi:hypothetical protein
VGNDGRAGQLWYSLAAGLARPSLLGVVP